MISVMHTAAAQAILSGASLAGREALIRDLASGAHLTTLAFSERGSRSQFWAPVSQMTAASFEHTGTALRDLPNLRARLGEIFCLTEQARALLGHTFDHLESSSAAAPLYVLQARHARAPRSRAAPRSISPFDPCFRGEHV